MMRQTYALLFSRTSRQSPSLLYNTIHSLATIVVSVILSLATSVIVARGLGPAAKGSVDLIMATTNLLVMAFGLSLPSGIVYVVARGRAALRPLLLYLVVITFFQTLLAGTFLRLILRSDISDAILPLEVQEWSFWAIILLIPANLLSGYFFGILAGLQEFPKANLYGLIGKTLSFFMILCLFLFRDRTKDFFSDYTVTWIVALSSIVSLLIFLVPIISLRLDSSYHGACLKEIFFYSIPAYFANVVQYLSYRLDIFIVNIFLGVREVGLYALALNISQTVWLFSGTISNVLYPNIASSSDISATTQRTSRIAKLTLWLNVAIALFIAVISKGLLPFVFGLEFQESVPALLWLLPGVAAFGITNVVSSYVVGIGKPKLTFLFALVCLFVMITLDIFLVPLWGVVGASIASSIAYFVTTVVSITVFVRESGANPVNMIVPDREDLKIIIDFIRRIMLMNK